MSSSKLINEAAAGAPYFTPAQNPPAGTALNPDTAPTVFKPLKIRGVTLTNRFVVSPMCQYSAEDGHMTDWHLVNLGQYAIHGNGLIFTEATAVLENGRISPEDVGLWKDSQIPQMKRIVDFIHSQGQKAGIQLAHAGRKASTMAPWAFPHQHGVTGVEAPKEAGGWPDNVWGPSAIKFADTFPQPKAMTIEDIKTFIQATKDAALRAIKAGFDVIELHGAHGYLLTEFLSPLSNQRTDEYGGSFENRTRLLVELVQALRSVIPDTMPLFVRVSSTEWMEWSGQPSWDVEQTIRLSKLLPALGVDVLDVSSGGNNSQQRIQISPYYQVSIAGQVRDALRKEGLPMLIGAVGMITNAQMAHAIVEENRDTVPVEEENGQITQADLLFVARQLIREPEFPLRVAHQLGVDVKWSQQYSRAKWAKDQKL